MWEVEVRQSEVGGGRRGVDPVIRARPAGESSPPPAAHFRQGLTTVGVGG